MSPNGISRLATSFTSDAPLATIRRYLFDLLQRGQRPDLVAAYLTGHSDFKDDLIQDLLNPSLIIRCTHSAKSSAEAATFALRLAFAEDVDYFAFINPVNIYRLSYFPTLRKVIETWEQADSSSPMCWNLIEQQWLPGRSDRPVPFHFNEGLGLSEEERRAGQKLGAPDTFLLNRAAARILILESWKHSSYAQGVYDQVWRQTLMHYGINITQVKTSQPTFVFVEKPVDTAVAEPPPPTDGPIEKSFPDGLADPSTTETMRLPVYDTDTPDVSIVIPTYNEGDWLFHTVYSLHTIETNRSFEIIVVDDGCNDGSVEKLDCFPDVRIVQTPHPQAGLIKAKNTGASHARGDHLCFVDSHMLMRDGWLDSMMSTIESSETPLFVTCGITDVMHFGTKTPLVHDQYGYVLGDWTFNVRWHHYGRGKFNEPFRVPLCPGGMSLMRRDRFEYLGGFCDTLRKWGSEDVELSLRHFCAGGETYCDPRTYVYHYFKNNKTRKPTFSITFAQTAFNGMFVARTYFSPEDLQRVHSAYLAKAKLHRVIEESMSQELEESIQKMQRLFTRSFEDWRQEFAREMKSFESATPIQPPPQAVISE